VTPKAPTYLMSVRSHGDAERPSESKISQFEIILFVDEKILRFEVPMQDSVGVTV